MQGSKFIASHWKLSLCLAVAYIATGYIGLTVPMFGTSITLIWLPTGISVGMLFRYGYACWPGVAVGALLTNLSIGSPVGVALGIACGNTLGPVLATYLLHRLRFERNLERQNDFLLLAVVAAVSMSINASLGIGTLSLAGLIQSDYLQAWFMWWAGDAMGIIAAAPIVFVLNRKELRFLNQRRIEFAWWMVVTLFLVFVIFILNGRNANKEFAVAFLVLPSMVWAAMRFGATGTSLGVILLSFSAAIGIANGSGPFKGKTPTEIAMLFSLFMMTCALVGWLVRYLNDAQRQTLVLQQLMERAMNDASLGLLLTNVERNITYANDGFSRMT
jgi:integral membrane sensor domain MASE1